MISEIMLRTAHVECLKSLFELGTIMPFGSDTQLHVLTLHTPIKVKNPKNMCLSIQRRAKSVVAIPITENNSYPTGHVGICLKRGVDIKTPVRLTGDYDLCFVEQSKHIPEMFLYALSNPQEQYIIDVVKQLGKDKDVRAAWLSSLTQFTRG